MPLSDDLVPNKQLLNQICILFQSSDSSLYIDWIIAMASCATNAKTKIATPIGPLNIDMDNIKPIDCAKLAIPDITCKPPAIHKAVPTAPAEIFNTPLTNLYHRYHNQKEDSLKILRLLIG